jgi:hypothetical protein
VKRTDRVSLCHEVTIRRQTPAQQPPPALDTSVSGAARLEVWPGLIALRGDVSRL